MPVGISLPPSLDLSFSAAEKYFGKKVTLTRADFDALQAEAQVYAFTVARISSIQIIADIQKEVQRAIVDGTTLEQFRAATMPGIMAKHGWSGLTPWHTETVFRTNVQMAYGVGQIEGLRRNADVFPFWQYSAINDHRVRPTHFALDGLIYPANHPFWRTHFPPWEYNCRCDVIPLTAAQSKDSRINTDKGPEPTTTFSGPGQLAARKAVVKPIELAKEILPSLTPKQEEALMTKLEHEFSGPKDEVLYPHLHDNGTLEKLKAVGASPADLKTLNKLAGEGAIKAAEEKALAAKYPHIEKVNPGSVSDLLKHHGEEAVANLEKTLAEKAATDAAEAAAAKLQRILEADPKTLTEEEKAIRRKEQIRIAARRRTAEARALKDAAKAGTVADAVPVVADVGDRLRNLSKLDYATGNVAGVDVPRDATFIEGHNLNVRKIVDKAGQPFYEFYGKVTSDDLADFALKSPHFTAGGARVHYGTKPGEVHVEASGLQSPKFRATPHYELGNDRVGLREVGASFPAEVRVNVQKWVELATTENRANVDTAMVRTFRVRIPRSGKDEEDFLRLTKAVQGTPLEAIVKPVEESERRRMGIIRAIVQENPLVNRPGGGPIGLGYADRLRTAYGSHEFSALKSWTSEELWTKSESALLAIAKEAGVKADLSTIGVLEIKELGYSTQTVKRAINYNETLVFHGTGEAPPSVVADIVAEGRLTTSFHRIRYGTTGVLNGPDMKSGGADSMFLRVFTKDNAGQSLSSSYGAGQVQFIFKAKELERLDLYAFNDDEYGRIYERKTVQRISVEETVAMQKASYEKNNEVMFRRGLNFDNLKEIVTTAESVRTQLLYELRQRGITHIAGKRIEDAVVYRARISAAMFK